MDRFKELREMVQRFGEGAIGGVTAGLAGGIGGIGGIGSGGGRSGSNGGIEEYGLRDTNKILDSLPLTRGFVEHLPRQKVIDLARLNDEKAAEALKLIQRVDELVSSHSTVATDLSTFLSTMSNLRSGIENAETLATSLHNQLLDLDALVAAEERRVAVREAALLQQAEDERFEAYARERRTALLRKKEEYSSQLDKFRDERIAFLASSASSNSIASTTTTSSPVPVISPSLVQPSYQGLLTHIRKGSKSRTNKEKSIHPSGGSGGEEGGLEKVLLYGDEEFERDRRVLEGFLGDYGGGNDVGTAGGETTKEEEDAETGPSPTIATSKSPQPSLLSPQLATTSVTFQPTTSIQSPLSPSPSPSIPLTPLQSPPPLSSTSLPFSSPTPISSPLSLTTITSSSLLKKSKSTIPALTSSSKTKTNLKTKATKQDITRANNLVVNDEDLDLDEDDLAKFYGSSGSKTKGKGKR